MLNRRLLIVLCSLITAGCLEFGGAPSSEPQSGSSTQPAPRPLDSRQAKRIGNIMVPLVRVMDHSRGLNEVRVAIIDDPRVNAASAGGGEFYVTTGLLAKANDDQLRGVLAHELAHDDLGHAASAQARSAGVGIGVVILDQIFPGSGQITPIAGALITRRYSREEEYAADRHGVELLRRAGYSRKLMVQALTWLQQTEGSSTGGFLSTHPGTQERIDALQKLSHNADRRSAKG